MSQSSHRPSHNIPHQSASSHVDADAGCISEIVGETDCAKLGRAIVYQALRDIVCTGCGAPVRRGELLRERALSVHVAAARAALV